MTKNHIRLLFAISNNEQQSYVIIPLKSTNDFERALPECSGQCRWTHGSCALPEFLVYFPKSHHWFCLWRLDQCCVFLFCDYNCDSTTIRLRSDYDVSRAPASIRRDSTRAKNEHVTGISELPATIVTSPLDSATPISCKRGYFGNRSTYSMPFLHFSPEIRRISISGLLDLIS